jgi:hypothetical protein
MAAATKSVGLIRPNTYLSRQRTETLGLSVMSHTLEIDDELQDRLENHLEAGESIEEFLEELVNMYETEGAFLQEGYSE